MATTDQTTRRVLPYGQTENLKGNIVLQNKFDDAVIEYLNQGLSLPEAQEKAYADVLEKTSFRFPEIYATPNGAHVRESGTTKSFDPMTEIPYEELKYISTPGEKRITYNPYKAAHLDYVWRNGGYYNGKYIHPSRYANLGNEVAGVVAAPITALNPVTGMLTSAAWDGAGYLGKAALDYGTKLFAGLTSRQLATQAAGRSAGSAFTPTANYLLYMANGPGSQFVINGTTAALTLSAPISTFVPQALTTAAVLSPAIGGWNSTNTEEIIGDIPYVVSENTGNAVGNGGDPQNNNNKKDKLSILQRIRERYKNMSPLNKYSWLAALGWGGYQASLAWKDYLNAAHQTDSAGAQQQIVIPFQPGQAPTDTLKKDTADTVIYYDQYNDKYF